jgi:uncharacterized protein (TIGR02996 family)
MFPEEELALIAAIHADPRDDAPRLTYADWLAAHDQGELAELIRLTCRQPYFDLRMSRTTPWKPVLDWGFMDIQEDDPERVRRSIELLERIYGSERLPENDHPEFFRRGLPVCEINTERGLSRLDDVEIDVMPLARFRLYLVAPGLAAWLDHPIMQRVDILSYHPEYDWDAEDTRLIEEDDIRALLASPLVDRLEKFEMCGESTPGAEFLARDDLSRRVRINYSY